MTHTDTVLHLVDINDENFFALSEEQLEKWEDALFALERFDTMVINAPKKIDVARWSSFPILYISQSDDIREWYVQEYRNLIVAAYNKSTGRLIAKTARKDEKRKVYPPKDERSGPPPKDISTTSYGTGCEIINIKHSLDIPRQPAAYCVTLICFDWVSNTVDVVLHDGDTHPETNLVLPRQDDLVVDAIVSSSKDAGKGTVTFSVPEQCDTDPSSFGIQGKFSVPVSTDNCVDNDGKKSILIPAWFMIVEKNIDQGPATLAKWFISADMPEKPGESTVAEGIFKFSLPEILPMITEDPLTPNDYCCYMLINGHVFGPQKCTVSDVD